MMCLRIRHAINNLCLWKRHALPDKTQFEVHFLSLFWRCVLTIWCICHTIKHVLSTVDIVMRHIIAVCLAIRHVLSHHDNHHDHHCQSLTLLSLSLLPSSSSFLPPSLSCCSYLHMCLQCISFVQNILIMSCLSRATNNRELETLDHLHGFPLFMTGQRK